MLQPDVVTRDLPVSSGWNLSQSAKVSDRQLTLIVSVVLFAVSAWPLTLTEVPPYQDLPNHLATATVIDNLKAYPEYVFNGFFKTNAALFVWLHFVGKAVGLKLAAKLFALGTLALNALVLPRFVFGLTQSRAKMIVASLFAWPMVHNWFVSMGMLDFALAVPISLVMLLALDRQRTAPSHKQAGIVIALGFATWYAHVFPLLVVHLLLAIEVLGGRRPIERIKQSRAMLFSIAPVTALALLSIVRHLHDTVGPMTGYVDFTKVIAPWELAYNLWAEWSWGYSNLSLSSLVPVVLLAFFAIRTMIRREAPRPAFFSPLAFIILGVLYCFMPYKLSNWFHVNSRLIPFLFIGLLLYVPSRLPRSIVGVLGLSAFLYSAGMGTDYIRLERERQEFSAGMDAVPEGSRLLPLLFSHKSASANTRNLLHMWGYYVVEKKTSAPLLFAHSHSFPVTYSAPPPARLNHLVLESFASEAKTASDVCGTSRRVDCEALFQSTWGGFWTEATPHFDHVLLWDPTPEVIATIPSTYERTFQRGRLTIFAKK